MEKQRAGKKTTQEAKKTKKCEEDENTTKKDGEKEAEGSDSGSKGRKRKVQANGETKEEKRRE